MHSSNIITQNVDLLGKLILSQYKKCYHDIFWCILILKSNRQYYAIDYSNYSSNISTNRFRCCTYDHISR